MRHFVHMLLSRFCKQISATNQYKRTDEEVCHIVKIS